MYKLKKYNLKNFIIITAISTCSLFIEELSPAKSKPTDKNSEAYQQIRSNIDSGASDKALAEADRIRLQGISSTYGLIKDKSIQSSAKFELYLRLGQLHLERHDYLKHVELKNFGTRYDKFIELQKLYKDKGYIKKLKALKEPVVKNSGSKGELRKSINALVTAVTKYPNEKRLDIALFTLGKSKILIKDKDAHKPLKRLVTKFKKSDLFIDANLELGEYYFDKGDHNLAIRHYKPLMSQKTHKGYLYAMYKLGWSNYNLSFKDADPSKKLTKALAALKIVVKQSKKQSWSKKLNLENEALNDLTMIFAELGDPKKAKAYFIPRGEFTRYYKTLLSIAQKLADKGQVDNSNKIYLEIINDAPFNINVLPAYTNLIRNYVSQKDLTKLNTGIKNMIAHLGIDGLWAKNPSKIKKPKMLEATKTLEQTVGYYGKKYHQVGQKSANQRYLLTGGKIYQLYLRQFPKGRKSIEIRRYLADILMSFKEYKAAGKHLMIIVKAPEGSKYKTEALDSAIFAFEKALVKEPPTLPKPFGKLTKPVKIPLLKLMYKDSLVTLIKNYPKDKRVLDAKFKVAEIDYQYGYYKDAIKDMRKIIAMDPSKKSSADSARAITTHYYRQENWLSVINSSSEFFKNKQLMMQKDLRKTVVELSKNSYFNYASQLEKNNKFVSAGKYFDKYQKLFATDKNADKALYNAATNFYRGGETSASINAGKKLITQYPKSKLAKETSAWVAEILEATARFEEAIAYYSQYHKNYPNDKRSREFLYSAAILSNGLQLHDQSINLFNMYSKFYPKDPYIEEIKFNTAEIYHSEGKLTNARKIYEWLSFNSQSEERRLEAKALGMLILSKQDKKSGISRMNSMAKQLANNRKDPALQARKIVSEEMIKSLEPTIIKFNKLTVKNGENLMQDIGAKNQLLLSISQRLNEIASVGLPEYTAAAYYIIGELHENMATDITGAPLPKNSSKQELVEISQQLVTASKNLSEESNKYYQESYNAAKNISTFSDWSIKIIRKMKEKFPDQIAIAEIETIEPDYLAHKITFDETTEKLVQK